MNAVSYRRGKALHVSWVDSTHTDGWRYGEVQPVPVERIASIGFCAGTSADGINLTTSLSRNGGQLGFITIPWGAILHIQDIEDWDWDNTEPDDGLDETLFV